MWIYTNVRPTNGCRIGAITTYYIREAWILPLVLFVGGGVSIITSQEKNLWNRVKLSPPWGYLFAFGFFALGSILLTVIWDNQTLNVFESFYRYGYLVIGGGQIVVPLMYSFNNDTQVISSDWFGNVFVLDIESAKTTLLNSFPIHNTTNLVPISNNRFIVLGSILTGETLAYVINTL